MTEKTVGELMMLTGSIHDLAELCPDPVTKSHLLEIAAKQEEHVWSLRLRMNYFPQLHNLTCPVRK